VKRISRADNSIVLALFTDCEWTVGGKKRDRKRINTCDSIQFCFLMTFGDKMFKYQVGILLTNPCISSKIR